MRGSEGQSRGGMCRHKLLQKLALQDIRWMPLEQLPFSAGPRLPNHPQDSDALQSHAAVRAWTPGSH